jgi:HD-like signal output (HDOD) protein/GGDEF domain-containing protein
MPTVDLDSVQSRLLASAARLPLPPAPVLELQRLAATGGTPRQAAQVLESDPALLGRLVRLANAGQVATFAAVHEPGAVCARLGLRTTAAMAAASAYAGLVRRATELPPRFTMSLARRAVAGAVAARSLARRGAIGSEDDAFLSGLLVGIGQLALALALPDVYGPLLDRTDGELPTAELERRELGFDHGAVEGQLLRQWGLSEVLCAAVAAAAGPERFDRRLDQGHGARLCEALHTAHLAGRVTSDDDRARAMLELQAALTRRFDAPRGSAVDFLRSLAPAMAEVSDLLGFPTGPGLDLFHVAGDAAEEAATLLEDLGREQGSFDDRLPAALPPTARLDPETQLPGADLLRPILRTQLERRANDGLPIPVGLLAVRAVEPTDLRALAADLQRMLRDSDQVLRAADDVLLVITPGTTAVSLRDLGHRLCQALSEPAEGRAPRRVLAGGACADRVRRAGECEWLLEEALLALERAGHRAA